MNHLRSFPLRGALLAAILILGGLADLAGMAQPAQAQIPLVNGIVAGVTLIGAGARRRNTYIAADQNQREFNQYYDSLRNTARTQLVSGELRSLRNTDAGLQSVRAGAYVKLDAALRAEQAAVTRSIEAEKNAARLNFNRTVVQTLTNLVLSTPGAQQLLGQVRTVISNLRASVVALQSAIAAGRPFEVIREQLASQVQESSRVQNAVRNLGTMLGQELDHAMGGALTRVDQALSQAQQEMADAATSLNNLDAQVGALSTARPNVLTGDRTGLPFDIRMTDRANAMLDAASSAIAFISAIQGSRGTTRDEMYQQIRSQMLQEHNVELLHGVQSVRSVTCTGVGRGEYETAMGMLGKTPGVVPDPEDASYIVCRLRDTDQVVYAYIVGGGAEATATPGEGTPTPTTDGEIPVGTWVGTTGYEGGMGRPPRTIVEDTITITIAEDGGVQGEMRFEYDDPNQLGDCTTFWHSVITGTVSGHLRGQSGNVDLHIEESTHYDPSQCFDEAASDWTHEFDPLATITVVGDSLTGQVWSGGVAGGQVWFEFSATRQ